MGQTIAEKILAKAAGQATAPAGSIVEVEPDLVLTHDHQGPMTIREFRSFGRPKVWRPERHMMCMDHRTPTQNFRVAMNHKLMREFCREQGIEKLYDVGLGITHNIIADKRLIKPGQIVIGTDSHTTTSGALGAFGTGIGSSEMAAIWARGRIWFRVPETIRVVLTGRMGEWVEARDITFEMLRHLNTDGATYKAVQFEGDGVADLSIEERLTLANMVLEMGAKTALFPVDDRLRAYFAEAGITNLDSFEADADATYCETMEIDLGALVPMVSRPNSPGNVDHAANVTPERRRIDQAVIGTCTNGTLPDLRRAAEVLKGRKVHPAVRMFIVPATREINEAATREGLIDIFTEAGAMVGIPGCGPCGAYGMGALADGEVCITTSSRNFVGRLGSVDCETYLGSPSTTAASAVAGFVIDPASLVAGAHEEAMA